MVNVEYIILNAFTTANMSFIVISTNTCLIHEGYVKSKIIQTIQFFLDHRLCLLQVILSRMSINVLIIQHTYFCFKSTINFTC